MGVYLTYVAIPLIVLSGLVMKFTKPNPKTEKVYNEVKTTVKEMGKATNSFLSDANSSLKELNKSLEAHNQKMDLIVERTADLKKEILQIKVDKAKAEVELISANSDAEKEFLKEKVSLCIKNISLLEKRINTVKKECELEIDARKIVN